MKVKAMCPASCGELLQGVIGEGEKLISYPIDLYSVVTIQESNSPMKNTKRKKAVEAMYKTLEFFGVSKRIGDTLSVDVVSHIPVAKGMASSTADIAAAAVATAKLLQKDLSKDDLARICIEIEPTDSTIFESLTLFDHLNGKRIESFDWKLNLDVLVLESYKKLNTQTFRKKDYSSLRMNNKEKVENAYKTFESGFKAKDLSLLGKAATISSLTNQNILFKDKLEDIIEVALKHGCYGINVAHSGTVIGIIFEKNKIDLEKLIESLRKESIYNFYYKHYLTKIVRGGVRILEY